MLNSVNRPCRRLVQVLIVGLSLAGLPQVAAAADLKASAVASGQRFDLAKSDSGLVSVIVKFDADSLASYKGGVAGLAATSPEANGTKRLDRNSSAYKAYESFLLGKERTFEKALGAKVPEARIVHRYRTVIGGASLILPRERVAALAGLPGVKAIYPDVLLNLDTDRSPQFIGAPTLWSQVGGQSKAGEGVVVGIVDTGIWPEHPSVADTGFPAPPAHWHGTACDFSGGPNPGDSFACNHKLIGAARFMDTFDEFGPAPLAGEFTSARDNNGHGSHTMTTAAGNANVDALGGLVTGIAPRAQVAAYKVCFTVAVTGQGSCYSSDSAAAVEQAIVDGVDVINFSIGGGSSPYSDAVSLAFLDAYAAGVFVACSAGNSGPGANTVEHREPWTTSTAALTTDKGFNGHADLTADGGATLSVTGIMSAGAGVGPFPIVLSSAAPYTDDLCLAPASAGTFTGKIVACKRGTNARAQKSANVAAGGAEGMILYNPSPGTLNADVHKVPSLHIDDTQGPTLVTFINGHTNPAATIVRDSTPGIGDVMADFSSRGGTGQTLGISKPDVGAPGVNILAANTPALAVPLYPGQADLFQIISGTSMASPHVAGAAAVLSQLHSAWTPGQIKSALMLSATNANTVKENGVTPTTTFDLGSGRIDLTKAGDPGLTINETASNYFALQNNLEKANYPSLYTPVNPGKVSVTRTLKTYDQKAASWSVKVNAPADLVITTTPKTLEYKKKDVDKPLKIDIDASAVPVGQVRQANLLLKNGKRSLTIPITVVRKDGAITLAQVCDDTDIVLDDTTVCEITATNNSFSDADVTITDTMPKQLKLLEIEGGDIVDASNLRFIGTLAGQTAPLVEVGDGVAPFGYFPVSGIGGTPNVTLGDESIVNLSVPAFLFGGQVYTSIGMTSNGYAIVGGGTAADVQFANQNLPNSAIPNNVLAPYWTDLNGAAGGTFYAYNLTCGTGCRFLLLEWKNIPEFTNGGANSFQIWIWNADTVPENEWVSFAYGATGDGDGGFLTVGAENFRGDSGQNYYLNGAGTLPTPTTEIQVFTAPGEPGESHVIDYLVKGKKAGAFRNCAQLTSSAMFGTATACVDGEVVVPD